MIVLCQAEVTNKLKLLGSQANANFSTLKKIKINLAYFFYNMPHNRDILPIRQELN